MAGSMVGRVALVSGGSGGVGQAVARDLAARGAAVALTYRRNADRARAVVDDVEAAGGRAIAVACDLTDAEQVGRTVSKVVADLGGLDILAHCAGADVTWKPVRDLDPAAYASFVEADLIGAFNVIHHAVRVMHEAGRGSIVAISSIAAQMVQPRNAQGASAKAGLEALVRVVAREEGRYGIRANVVSIGLTDTEQARIAFDMWGPQVTEQVIKGIPLQRIARPEEVARMVAFLAGDEGSYVTGKVIQVDGGQIIAG